MASTPVLCTKMNSVIGVQSPGIFGLAFLSKAPTLNNAILSVLAGSGGLPPAAAAGVPSHQSSIILLKHLNVESIRWTDGICQNRGQCEFWECALC